MNSTPLFLEAALNEVTPGRIRTGKHTCDSSCGETHLLYVLHILTDFNVMCCSDLREQKIDNIPRFDLQSDTFDASQNSSAVGGSHTEKKRRRT